MHIPSKFSTATVNRWGDAGAKWLEQLPGIVHKCKQRFGVTLGTPFENAYANFVATAVDGDGREVILKIGYPQSEIHTEIEALTIFAGEKAVRIIRQDDDTHAVLLEKITPGYDLTTVEDDEKATTIAAALCRDLAAPVPSDHSLPTMTEWLQVIDRIGTDHNFPPDLLRKAVQMHHELESLKICHRVVHGDLHHENILYDQERGWLAIDPQGVIADPICEVGAFFYNPDGISSKPNIEQIYLRRAHIFADILQTDVHHVLRRAFVQSVISCCWSIEDNQGYEMACVKALEKLLNTNS